jgi:cytochrome c
VSGKVRARNGFFGGVLACVVTLANPAHAQQDGSALVEAARCYMCHQLSEPLVGPPYLAIAARHAPRSDVMVDVLARRIVDGGGGNWGLVPMVPNQWVTIDEARVMARWILSLAP